MRFPILEPDKILFHERTEVTGFKLAEFQEKPAIINDYVGNQAQASGEASPEFSAVPRQIDAY